MRALSIRQPWAWAILHAGKRVENRSWERAPRFMIGQSFLIHAAKGCTREEYEDAENFMWEENLIRGRGGAVVDLPMLPALTDLPRGAIVARARLSGFVRTDGNEHRVLSEGVPDCQLCGLGLPPDTCSRRDPWAVPGSLGLILADVVLLPQPIPFSGALGFFEVPGNVVTQINRSIGAP